MGSEQHTASLKNRLYKQKIPEGSHPPGSFFISVLPPHGAGCRHQGSAVSGAGRSGRRRCNTTQRQMRPVPEPAEKSGHSAPCAVCGALLSVHPVSGLSGRRCAVRASAGMALPYFCQIVPAACGRPEAARRIISSSHKAGVSCVRHCAHPAAFPAAQKQHRVLGALQTPGGIDLHPQGAALPAHGSVLPEWPAFDPADLCAQLFPHLCIGIAQWPQNQTPFLRRPPFPVGLPAECLHPHHSIPAACGAFPAPAPLHEQGSSPLPRTALPQSGLPALSGPCSMPVGVSACSAASVSAPRPRNWAASPVCCTACCTAHSGAPNNRSTQVVCVFSSCINCFTPAARGRSY